MTATTVELHIDTRRGGGTAYAATADNLTDRLIGRISYNVGMTDADQSFAPPSNLTVTVDNIDGAFNPDTLGADVLANDAFTTWSADNPTGWTVTGEVGADPEVSQVDAGELHVGTGTGAANFYSTSATLAISQTALTIGTTYRVDLEISMSAESTGWLGVYDNATLVSRRYHLAGQYTFYFNAESTTFKLATSGVVDITVNSVTARPVSKYGQLLSEGMLGRLRITGVGGLGSTLYYGRLNNFEVLPGAINSRVAVLTFSDWMLDLLDSEYIPPLYTNTTVDEPISDLLNEPIIAIPYASSYWALGVQGSSELDLTTYIFSPQAISSMSVGTSVIPYIGDNSIDGEDGVSAQSFLRDLVDAEIYGRFFYNPNSGGYVFHNRQRDALGISSDTITENDYEPNMSTFWRAPVINQSTLTFEPRVAGTPGTVIWAADNVPIGLFREKITITARYRDLANPSARIGASDVLNLFPGTDYIIIEPESGTDVTTSVKVSMKIGANSAEITIDNTRNTYAINVTKLQIRGTPLKTFNQQTVTSADGDSKFDYKSSPETVHYALVSTANDAQAIADFRVYRNSSPISAFKTIGWVLNKSSTRMTRGLGMAVGTYLTISDSWMGHNANYVIVGFRHSIVLGGENHHEITCILKPGQREAYWVLDTSLLGISTRLAL